MKRGYILICLILIGLIGVYQYFPFFKTYTFGIINTIYFFGLCFLYILFLIYELYLNIKEVKYEKKKFDKSSVWITLTLLLILIIFLNTELFESKIILKAKGNHYCSLNLKENGRFILRQRFGDHSDFYKGKYIIKNDTLRLFQNDKLSRNLIIDTVYIRKDDSLIPENHTKKFVILNSDLKFN